jgi:hypothetical protein
MMQTKKNPNKMETKKDLLNKMLDNRHLSGETFLETLLQEGKNTSARRKGYLYESIFQILILLKCIGNIHYTEMYDGPPSELQKTKDLTEFLEKNVETGDNVLDLTLKFNNTYIFFSCKYKGKYGDTGVSSIRDAIKSGGLYGDYKIALIVKNRELITQHRYTNKQSHLKLLHDEISKNNLLFGEEDAVKGLDKFVEQFSNYTGNIDEFIEFINETYFLSSRKQLTMKLHQKMTELKFIELLSQPSLKSPYFCLAHKPRSGKSITLLTLSKYLLTNGYSKILFLTSVPATIASFVKDMKEYVEFRDIPFVLQKDVDSLDSTFCGIVLCSTEYLKMDPNSKKRTFLKRMNFDASIIDESHQGSSNERTKTDLLEEKENDDINKGIETITKNTKITIFASGTSLKTQRFYRIPKQQVFEWEMEDESYMKQILTKNKIEMIDLMVSRHGSKFLECLNNPTLDKDYSSQPTQILLKNSIEQTLINDIISYNQTNNVDFGYHPSSLFALRQEGEDKRGYENEFEICKHSAGENILIAFLDSIISNDPQKDSVMKQIEGLQYTYRSRKSTTENPLIFIVYLPVNTGNGNIRQLQETLVTFLEKHGLWNDYLIEYSNSMSDTGNTKETYTKFIDNMMIRFRNYNDTHENKKKGCILLLGSKGTVGITYELCDVTISLDSGHNLENQKQKYARALTAQPGKTIGINVDMNIQRSYSYLLDVIHKHRKSNPSNKSYAEIVKYLFENNIFLFDPHRLKNGSMNMKPLEILQYYQGECDKMMREVDDSYLLEGIECNDDMRDMINNFHYKSPTYDKVNPELEGENQDCPKGGITNIKELESKKKDDEEENVCEDKVGEENVDESEQAKMEDMINRTCELCKQFLFPLMALISRIYHISDFKEIFTNEITLPLIMDLIKDKIDLDLLESNIFIQIMSSIIDMNDEIVNNIREIYSTAPSGKLRTLIEKHFIPSQEEKKKNAEVPTPVRLVDDMLGIIPSDFWKTPKKVFEPCCGKGNFVLGIFDKFWVGLEELYPDYEERCRVIITECLHYADITPLNVFITTEILKCHVQSYCELEELEWEFHSFVGDTLKMKMSGFNAVIGNPPYNNSQNNKGRRGGGDLLWNKFVKKSIDEYLVNNGLLVFVHPPGWRKPETSKSKYNDLFSLMTKENQIVYLEIHNASDGMKMFHCGTRYDWYMIEKTPIYKNTIIKCQNGNIGEFDLSKWCFLPNSMFEVIQNMLSSDDDEVCNVLQSTSVYESRKKHVSAEKNDIYKYTLIHSTPQKGVRYMYSSVNNKGHFGIPKVIFGDSGISNSIIDINGDYGMTQHAIAIEIKDIAEGENIKRVIDSNKFKEILDACSWSNYQIDWRLFTEFKKDFWKEFV